MEDLITVGIPAYNHEKYVQETIKSIINQTYENIELVVLDDGSTDSTWEKILEMKPECEKRFSNIHFEKQENMGCTRTNQKLVDLANGKYYMVIASDDLAKPNALEVECNFLKNHPNFVHCVGDCDLIDSNSKYVVMDAERKITKNNKFQIWEKCFNYYISNHSISKSFIMLINNIIKSSFLYIDYINQESFQITT